jgi:hypothetical protein
LQLVTLTRRELLNLPRAAEVPLVRGHGCHVTAERCIRILGSAEAAARSDARRDQ